MRAKSLVGLAVGPADDYRWGQVLIQPTGYGIVEIHSAEGRAQELGAHVLSQLGNIIADGPKGLRALERAVDGCMSAVVRSMIVFAPVGRILYVALRGDGAVYLKRGNQIASLMHQPGGISGEVRRGDTLIIVSGGFSRLFTRDSIIGFFDHEPPEVVAERLTLALHEKQDGSGSVALVYQVEQFEETESEAPTPHTAAIPGRMHTWKTQCVSAMDQFRRRPEAAKKILVIALICLFGISVFVGVMKQAAVTTSREVQLAVVDARHAFEEGVALLALNPVKGRQRLTQAKQYLDPVVGTVNARSGDGRKIMELYKQIQDNLTQSMQITRAEPILFYDMSLLKKEAKAGAFSLAGTHLVVGDTENGTMYSLDIASKKAAIIGGGDTARGLSTVAASGDSIYAFTSRGIVEFQTGDRKPAVAIGSSNEWGNIGSMVAYGGNIYLLDRIKSRIWKYVSVDNASALNAESVAASESASTSDKTGFSSIREYLNPDTLPDFSQATNMTIDGTVWVGSRTGRLSHFVQGREETFTPEGAEPELGNDLQVFATDETKSLYVLDRQNNRVVVLDKEGTYLAQYQWQDFAVSAFVVSEEQKKILLLAEGKIYSIDLK